MTNSSHTREAAIAVYLGLGSNLGDREANLSEARARIKKLGLEIARESSIYKTEPVGFRDQPWFLNQVIEVKFLAPVTSESEPISVDPETIAAAQAEDLLRQLLETEREMGRERTVAKGPRLIDIDLLLFGDKVIAHSKEDEKGSLVNRTEIFVPHPRMHQRRFVLEPLCEIAPELLHPVLKKACREILASLDDDSLVRICKRSSSSGE